MSILPIYNCFHPVLKKKTKDIENFDQNLKDLVDNMFDTMYHTANGVGLAGNQVGEEKSVIVIDLSVGGDHPRTQPLTLINPIITFYSDEIEGGQEGCLSIPDYYEMVPRSKSIQIKYFDVDMKEYNQEVSDFLARVIQHEVDHLNGKLIFERISPLKRALSKSKLRRIQKGEIIPDYPMIQANGILTTPESN